MKGIRCIIRGSLVIATNFSGWIVWLRLKQKNTSTYIWLYISIISLSVTKTCLRRMKKIYWSTQTKYFNSFYWFFFFTQKNAQWANFFSKSVVLRPHFRLIHLHIFNLSYVYTSILTFEPLLTLFVAKVSLTVDRFHCILSQDPYLKLSSQDRLVEHVRLWVLHQPWNSGCIHWNWVADSEILARPKNRPLLSLYRDGWSLLVFP